MSLKNDMEKRHEKKMKKFDPFIIYCNLSSSLPHSHAKITGIKKTINNAGGIDWLIFMWIFLWLFLILMR